MKFDRTRALQLLRAGSGIPDAKFRDKLEGDRFRRQSSEWNDCLQGEIDYGFDASEVHT